MTIVTKAALAAELGVTKTRVSQYAREGLPVRSDGRLDREEALRWISERYPAYGRERQAGVNRAASLVAAVKPKPAPAASPALSEPNVVDQAMVNAVAEVVSHVGPVVASLAIKLGLTCEQAYALNVMAFEGVATGANAFLARCGLDAFAPGGRATMTAMASNRRTDWPALAEKARQPVELEAWAEFAEQHLGEPAHGQR